MFDTRARIGTQDTAHKATEVFRIFNIWAVRKQLPRIREEYRKRFKK